MNKVPPIALANTIMGAWRGLPSSRQDRRMKTFTNKQWKRRKHKRKIVETSRRKNR